MVDHLDPMALLARVRREHAGFLQESDVAALRAHPEARFWRLLVRCGGGRFIAPAQDVAHFRAIIGREGSDYVRDVSLLAGETYKVPVSILTGAARYQMVATP